MTIRDYGAWRARRQHKNGGFGFPLMRSLMGAVHIDHRPEGTRITLSRRLPRHLAGA